MAANEAQANATQLQIPKTPANRWASLPSRYDVEIILGNGAYGTVCEAYDHDRGGYVAIKHVRQLFRNTEDAKRTLREVAILRACAHDHVMQIYDLCIPEQEEFSEIYIVMESCDSDMQKLIYSDVTITVEMVQLLMRNLLVGLKYLHSAGVYHRDLKPANVLIMQDCTVKICDFNLARALGAEALHAMEADASPAQLAGVPTPLVPSSLRERQLTGHVVTRSYRAPEVLMLEASYNEKIDVWSAGCIFGELLQVLEGGKALLDRAPLFRGSFSLRTPPKQERRGREMLDVIFECLGKPSETQIAGLDNAYVQQYVWNLPTHPGNGLRRRLPFVQDNAMLLLERMLHLDPAQRATMHEALEHIFLADVRDISLEVTAASPIELHFESERHLGCARLRELFREQARHFNHSEQSE